MALESSKTDSYKFNVKAASTANVTLNISMLNGTWVYPIIDGYQTVKGDRVLLKDQTDTKTNGIYVVQPGKLYLATDNNSNTSLINGAIVKVVNGNINAGKTFEIAPVNPLNYDITKVWSEVISGAPELIFAADLAAIELLTGEADKQYIAEDTGNIYRWNGSAYIEMSASGVNNLADTLTAGRTVDATGTILTNNGEQSIDVNNRFLADEDNAIALEWKYNVNENRSGIWIPNIFYAEGDVLLDTAGAGLRAPGGGLDRINFEYNILYDELTHPALSWSHDEKTLHGNLTPWKYLDNNQADGYVMASDANGVMSWQDPNNLISIPPTPTLAEVLDEDNKVNVTGTILTNDGNPSIDVNNRALKDLSGNTNLDWQQKTLFEDNLAMMSWGQDSDYLGGIGVHSIYDSNKDKAIRIPERELYNSTGTVTVNWGVTGGTGFLSNGIKITEGVFDNGNFLSMIPTNRWLFSSADTGQPVLDWDDKVINGYITGPWTYYDGNEAAGKVLTDVNGDGHMTWQDPNSLVSTPTLAQVLDEDNKVNVTGTILSSDGGERININERKLYADDFGIAIEWGLSNNPNGYAVISAALGEPGGLVNVAGTTGFGGPNNLPTIEWGSSMLVKSTAPMVAVLDWEALEINTSQGSWKYLDGNQAAGYVMTSDVDGNMTWSAPAVKTIKVPLTASEVGNANTTPVSIIPAPGAGKAICIESVSAKLNYNTTAFDSMFLYLGPVSLNTDTAQFYSHDLFTYAGNSGHTFFNKYFYQGLAGAVDQIKENAPIYFYSSVDDTANGDGTIDLYITYKIIEL